MYKENVALNPTDEKTSREILELFIKVRRKGEILVCRKLQKQNRALGE